MGTHSEDNDSCSFSTQKRLGKEGLRHICRIVESFSSSAEPVLRATRLLSVKCSIDWSWRSLQLDPYRTEELGTVPRTLEAPGERSAPINVSGVSPAKCLRSTPTHPHPHTHTRQLSSTSLYTWPKNQTPSPRRKPGYPCSAWACILDVPSVAFWSQCGDFTADEKDPIVPADKSRKNVLQNTKFR